MTAEMRPTGPEPSARHAKPQPRGDGEPCSGDAARLIRETSGLGTVERLDAVHDALVKAYRAGQRDSTDQ